MMNFRRFLEESKKRITRNGWEGLRESVYQFYYGMWINSARLYDPGEPIWNRDWDVLVVLDACRADVMDEVANEFEFIDHHSAVLSNASSSNEWMRSNFSHKHIDQIRETAYVSGNPHTESDLPTKDEFAILDETWKYGWDNDIGTIPPETLTDRAIQIWREGEQSQMIIHYMQPHFPSIPDPKFESRIKVNQNDDDDLPGWDSVWRQLRLGNGDVQEVWEAYRENLRYVLSNIKILLQSIEADQVVITADHGNAFGEYGIYGHPAGTPIEVLRKVPWCETSASETKEYEPGSIESNRDVSEDTVEERLSDLGYL